MLTGCGDVEELHALIAVSVESPEYYTPNSFAAYQTALINAREIENKTFSSQSEIDAAAKELQKCINGLTPRADKTELIAAKDAATQIDSTVYLPITYKTVEEAISDAETVINDDNALEADVKVAITALTTATEALVPRPDKTGLEGKYGEAQAVDTTLYLSASLKAFNEAKENAKTVIADDNATQDVVDAAITKIDSATASLEVKPDKTNLSVLIEKAEKTDETKYTTVSYNALQKAIPGAKAVFNNAEATQAEVDAALTALQAEVDGLVKSTKCVWKITTSLRKTATNHVGNDWSSGVFYNGNQVYSGFEVTAREGSSISVMGKAVENDNVPDVGTGSVSLKLTDGNSAETTFYVRENRGRYSGNCAVWELEVSCKLIERV